MSKRTKNNKRLRGITEHIQACTACSVVDRESEKPGGFSGQCHKLDGMIKRAVMHNCSRRMIQEARTLGQTLRMLNPPIIWLSDDSMARAHEHR